MLGTVVLGPCFAVLEHIPSRDRQSAMRLTEDEHSLNLLQSCRASSADLNVCAAFGVEISYRGVYRIIAS